MTWIVAFTKKGCEHLAVMNLEAQGYDCYLPLAMSPDKPTPEPFFPRYVFVDTAPNEGIWRPIRSTRGCLMVLMTGEAPSAVPEWVIDTLRRREEAGVIRLRARAKAQAFKEGDKLRVDDGPFCGFDAVFERLASGDRVRVLLDCFGKVTPVELEPHQVSAA